ncbi:hypothetical protein E2C01_040760 [Portunus trituberculatus]|uniref:Ig-like domain-containing protein n=1 Tax=Portunus trituberculatus TaxID=210409 RepID=A0A5B7FNB6_PORTR|nr:hypothetical protein [Portunus trituberculatus]
MSVCVIGGGSGGGEAVGSVGDLVGGTLCIRVGSPCPPSSSSSSSSPSSESSAMTFDCHPDGPTMPATPPSEEYHPDEESEKESDDEVSW